MATLQTDAVVELLPVRKVPNGYHANVRLIMAGVLPVSLPTIGPTATLDSLGDALASALASPLATQSGGAARDRARGRRARQRRGARAVCARLASERHREPRGHGAGLPVLQGLHRCRSGLRGRPCPVGPVPAHPVPVRHAAGRRRPSSTPARRRRWRSRSDTDSADARAALADLYAEDGHDWARAESEFHEALARDSSNVYARSRYAMLLAGRGPHRRSGRAAHRGAAVVAAVDRRSRATSP